MKLQTTTEVALVLGLSSTRVRQLATQLGVGSKPGRDWVFNEKDLTALVNRNRRSGRPPKPLPPPDAAAA